MVIQMYVKCTQKKNPRKTTSFKFFIVLLKNFKANL